VKIKDNRLDPIEKQSAQQKLKWKTTELGKTKKRYEAKVEIGNESIYCMIETRNLRDGTDDPNLLNAIWQVKSIEWGDTPGDFNEGVLGRGAELGVNNAKKECQRIVNNYVNPSSTEGLSDKERMEKAIRKRIDEKFPGFDQSKIEII